MKSIIQKEKECYICHRPYNLHEHHIFYGNANRELSEADGMKVWLCGHHHNLSNEGVHFNKHLDLFLKGLAQDIWEQTYGSREDFMKRYGKNYIQF